MICDQYRGKNTGPQCVKDYHCNTVLSTSNQYQGYVQIKLPGFQVQE
jgi:hypothetical protein